MNATTVKPYDSLGKRLTDDEQQQLVALGINPRKVWIANAYSEDGRVLTDTEVKARDKNVEALRDVQYVRPKLSVWWRLKLWWFREQDSFRRLWESK